MRVWCVREKRRALFSPCWMFRQNRRTGALLGYVRTLFGLRVALERADPVWATCGPCEERADPSGVRGTLVGNVGTLRGYVGTLFGVRGDHFRGTFGSVLGYVWTLWGYVGTLSRYVGTLFGVRWTIVGYVEDPLGVRGDPSGIRGDPFRDTWGPRLGHVGTPSGICGALFGYVYQGFQFCLAFMFTHPTSQRPLPVRRWL